MRPAPQLVRMCRVGEDSAVAEALAVLGGVASRAALIEATSRREVDRALGSGEVTVLRRGWYALPSVEGAVAKAHELNGVLSLTSAALHHGWAVKTVPDEPHITVPRRRRVAPDARRGAQLHRNDLTAEDIDGVATSKELTLMQCLRHLPFDEALAVADSAARSGESGLLRRVANTAQGPGSPQVRRVAAAASADAANPFESVLRAIAADVPGLKVRPRVLITSVDPWVRPDLVDEDLRIVLEADSFEWHGGRSALRDDARRYDRLVVDGWLVLRFAWEDVMFDQEFVRRVLVGVVALVQGRTEVPCPHCDAA